MKRTFANHALPDGIIVMRRFLVKNALGESIRMEKIPWFTATLAALAFTREMGLSANAALVRAGGTREVQRQLLMVVVLAVEDGMQCLA